MRPQRKYVNARNERPGLRVLRHPPCGRTYRPADPRRDFPVLQDGEEAPDGCQLLHDMDSVFYNLLSSVSPPCSVSISEANAKGLEFTAGVIC